MKYFIKTFGCQQNIADSERMEAAFKSRKMTLATNPEKANYIVINTCMVRQSAENRIYGLVRNLAKIKKQKTDFKIIVTGCMTGMAARDRTGKFLKKIREKMPEIDEFLPIEEVGFNHEPVRQDKVNAWVPISNGCNNFCAFCVVPFTRGREKSRPYQAIIKEVQQLKTKGFKKITLLGQNVNSYGSDLISKEKNFCLPDDRQIKPVYVKHLGRYRIPTLFPYLLEDIAKIGLEKVDFISANPWDFSDQLIKTIARYPNISRTIHLPVQSGDDDILRRMNRWYTAQQYLDLIEKIRKRVPEATFTTDIIVGFCDETKQQFNNTVELCKKVNFEKAYLAMYSPRPRTAATKTLEDNIPFQTKKKRWLILEELINSQ